MRNRQARAVCALVAAVSAAAVGGTVWGADRFWVGADGATWTTAANWSPSGVPVDEDYAYVESSTNRTAVFGGSYSGTGLAQLRVDGVTSLGASMTLSQSTGALVAADEYVGNSGLGVYAQSGGSNTPQSLTVGNGVGSSGWYVLSNAGATLSAGTLTVANYGQGRFTQTAGTNSVSGTLWIAYQPGSSGTYEMSGGTLTAPVARAGYDANVSATFAQSGGTATFSSFLGLGGYSGASSGTVNLSGGTLQAAFVNIGDIGSGAWNQSAGTFSGTGTVRVGASAGSSGTVSLNGGTFGAAALTVGDAGSGSYYQSAGTTTVSGQITVSNAGGAGNLSLYGGAMTAGSLVNNDTYYQVGGTYSGAFTNNASATVSHGTVTIASSGGFNNAGSLGVAAATFGGTGTFNNNGLVGVSGTGVTFGESGGFANNAQFVVNAGNVTLSSAGSNSNSGNMDLAAGWQLRLTGSGLTNYGTLNLNGATVTGPGTLVDRYGATITGQGLITAPFSIQGGRLLVTDGTLNVTSSFSSSGVIQLTGPGASLMGGTITNSGTIQGQGSVANGVTNVGGTVESTGGTLILAGAVSNPASGLLTVSPGAKLLVTGTLATNAGTVNVNGGTFDTNGQTMQNSGIVAGYGVIRTGGLSNFTSMTLTGGNTTVNGSVTNSAGATINVRYNPALFTGAVNNSGTFTVTGTTATFASSSTGISEPGGVALGGMSSLAAPGLDVSDGGVGGGGTLVVDGAGSVTASYLRQGTLDDAGRVTLRPASQGGKTSTLNVLTLTGGGTLDLADNRLVIDYTGATPADAVRQYLLSARAGGTWGGSGLTSATAAADPQHRMAIGYAEASALGAATWGGVSVDATAVVTKLTWYGDANLDGRIDADDYALIDRGFARHLGGWVAGDFDYSGVVDAGDYLLIDRVFVQQGGTLSPGMLADREARFGSRYVDALVASVPEPTAGAVGAVLLAGTAARRRRRATACGR